MIIIAARVQIVASVEDKIWFDFAGMIFHLPGHIPLPMIIWALNESSVVAVDARIWPCTAWSVAAPVTNAEEVGRCL